jgi:hypothetical protein
MSNSWLRLWHDMPNDPKWRTISRISGQRIGDVQAVYMHLLTSASQNVTRGHADVTAEDLASAIDVTDEAIESILNAMQGRVLDGMRLTGWEKRQPKREDSGSQESGAKSSAERKRLQRERQKTTQESGIVTHCHDMSRNVTTDKDTETDKEPLLDTQKTKEKPEAQKAKRLPNDWTLPKSWGEWTLENMGWEDAAVRTEGEKFKDYWTAKGGREACKLDWQATWRNWCRNAKTPVASTTTSLLTGGI